jgi:exodeoxyribonuclease VII large subunit
VNEQTIYSVTAVNANVKMLLEQHSILSRISIQGEISNFKQSSNGHMYFTLKDEKSKLDMAMFAGANRALRFYPRDGMNVIVSGSMTIFERDGKYQMIVQTMKEAGLGQLFLQYEQLRARLLAEGMFDTRHKQSLPEFPKTIGVVTSPTGAVIRDIITTVRRRYPLANILLFPAQVQGADAPLSIVQAIESLNEHQAADVLIVGRGGGSLEELWAFNDERVVRAMFASNIPIISAVGHETDTTLADFVADMRAPTPTAAAELAVPDINQLLANVIDVRLRSTRALQMRLSKARERLTKLQRTSWLMNPMRELHQPMQHIDFLKQRLQQAFQIQLNKKRDQFRLQVARLDSLSPLKVMTRGYSLVSDSMTGEMVSSLANVKIDQQLQIRFVDGNVRTTVIEILRNGDGI